MRKKLRVKGAALAVLAGVLAAAAAIAAGQEHWPSTGGVVQAKDDYYPSPGGIVQAGDDYWPHSGGVVQAKNNTWTSEAFRPDFEAGTLDLRA
ncbi:hypothetical protein ACGF13_35005 [Kitasatospora sp. NPDC048286]|uniref:hypothetical protein n=1 Tax=Kitasatospora sp. NPDC048286 TaxID=3364047 RepID=UPI00372123AE